MFDVKHSELARLSKVKIERHTRKNFLIFGARSKRVKHEISSMRILIKNAMVCDPASKHHNARVDILIADGIIQKMNTSIQEESDTTIEAHGLMVSPGWFDLKADFCEPGNEHKETLESGAAAAERGGFTHVCLVSSTTPPVDNKAQIEFMRNKSQYNAVEILPIGCLSAGHQGKELAEMYDMQQSGAVLFSDDQKHVSTGLLYRAMLYAKNFGARIAVSVNDHSLAQGGLVNEGLASTMTGLKSIPAVAEILDIERNLRLMEYTDAPLHCSGLSTKEGVALIRKAKQQGLPVTCDVHVHQLIFNEEAVLGFDSNFKVMPPYRREEDRLALWEGVMDGTVDAIVSDHRPAHQDEKEVEFDYAAFGNVTLETFFPALASCAEFNLDAVLRAITHGAAQVLGKKASIIEENCPADLTLFTLEGQTVVEKDNFESLSFNAPFLGQTLKGSIVGVMNQGRLALSKSNAHA